MNIKKLSLFLMALLLIIFTAIGCSSNSNESSSSEGQTDAKEEKNTEDNNESGGELRTAIDSQPPSLDPHITTSAATFKTTRHIFETLVALDSEYKPVPMLAESVDRSEDGKTYTFHLRTGVPFHNGKEMTAEDVVASMERWLERNTSADLVLGGATFEATDDTTVEMHLPETVTGVLDVLATHKQYPAIMPKEVVEAADDSSVSEFIGTGPFKFVEWAQDQYIHITKFEDYVAVDSEPSGLVGKKEALVDDIFFEIVTDSSTRVAGVSTGLYDISFMMPYDNYEMLKNDDSLNTYETLHAQLLLLFNKKAGLFTNEKMRQAVNAALDIDEIMIATFAHEELFELDHGFMTKHQANWYTEAGINNYNQKDLEKAKQLLEEAGYNGEEITLLTSRDSDYYYSAAIVAQEQLREIGLNIIVDVYDWATLSERREDPSKWDIYTNIATTVNVPAQILPLGPDWAGWADDPRLIEMHKEIVHSTSEEDAKSKWDELHEFVWEEYVPVIKLGNFYSLDTTTSNVEGLTFFEGPVLWNTKLID